MRQGAARLWRSGPAALAAAVAAAVPVGVALLAGALAAGARDSGARDSGARAGEPVVAYTIVDARAIPESLTGAPGDPERGRALYAGEPRAGCADCHGLPGAPGGEGAAPDLADVGARLEAGEIRLWIVAPEAIDPDTGMPAFYVAGQRKGADDPLHGGPALTAAEVEDLVAYLAALRGPD